jgi:hypothetical protein
MFTLLVLSSKRCYKYQHKKVNKNIFFVLIINFFMYKLRAKRKNQVQNGSNPLVLNGFHIFYLDPENPLQFFDNSVGIALPY